jgi:ankyrin repeat protein
MDPLHAPPPHVDGAVHETPPAAPGIVQTPHSLWLNSEDCLLQVLSCVAFCGHPAWNYASLTRAFRGDEVLWGCIKDRRGPMGRTFLMACSGMGDLARVRWLLDMGANVNAAQTTTTSGEQYLKKMQDQWMSGDSAVTMTVETDDGVTSLMWACRNGHLEVVRELLGRGADVNAEQSYDGTTSLMKACQKGHLNIVRELLKPLHNVHVNAGEAYGGATSLMWASAKGYLEIVRELLGRGAHVNFADTDDVLTPLIWACKAGHLEVVQELLLGGADTAVHDEDEKTPLLWACELSRWEIARVLLKNGKTDVNAAQTDGWTSLMYASMEGCLEMARELLYHGANVNAARWHNESTALMEASRAGHTEIAYLLLAHGASKAAVDFTGKTAFELAPEACTDLRKALALQ